MAEVVAGQTPLKDANAKPLLAVLAGNAAAFYLVAHAPSITLGDWAKLATAWATALPAGLGVSIVGILNYQIGSDAKARLVFWRWHHPYPGSRAFTQCGPADPRVDMDALAQKFGPLPTDPKAQNTVWYRMYRSVADAPAVAHAHRHFLFARDYCFISLAMLVILGGAGSIYIRPLSTAGWYAAALAAQWALATRAANVAGHHFVTTVLAQKAASN